MTYKIEQMLLTPELKQYVYVEFRKHALSMTGVDGLSQNPTAFELDSEVTR
jgi:hypothetical protein